MGVSNKVSAKGKRLLIEAALKLTATTRSLSALSLREVAREAGLNPNTFYRHFKNFDDLGLAIIREMTQELRQPLRDLRREAADSVSKGTAVSWQENPKLNLLRSMEVTRVTVKLFFDYVEDHPNAFILGVRELHGASPVMRNALRSMMNDFAQDIAEDIQILNLLPEVNQATLLDIAEVIGREMFLLSMDYIEQPEQRSQICEKAQRLITSLTVGHAVLNGYGPVLSEALS
ncbi:MAG: TetR family transcriptional regulator [Pseudomonadales bacterium]|nr:TetR family transcriptional regulator [Pseudomonadales bacterium]